MSMLIPALLALGTLAFGAVYPWAYVPLFAAAAAVGIAGLKRGGLLPGLRPLAIGCAVLCAAAAIQLVPLPAAVVHLVSPYTREVMSGYDLRFADDAGWIRLSIDPGRTLIAVAALGALGLYVIGCPALLDGRGLRVLPRGLAFVAVPLALFAIYTREFNNGLIYGFWRPETAVRLADTDGNPATTADPQWRPLLGSPPFPDYTSGHSTFSGSSGAVLTGLFGPAFSFSTFADDLPDVSRTFTSFNSAAEEAGISRIYGGIHFNFANQDGLASGRQIAEFVLANYLRPV